MFVFTKYTNMAIYRKDCSNFLYFLWWFKIFATPLPCCLQSFFRKEIWKISIPFWFDSMAVGVKIKAGISILSLIENALACRSAFSMSHLWNRLKCARFIRRLRIDLNFFRAKITVHQIASFLNYSCILSNRFEQHISDNPTLNFRASWNMFFENR